MYETQKVAAEHTRDILVAVIQSKPTALGEGSGEFLAKIYNDLYNNIYKSISTQGD